MAALGTPQQRTEATLTYSNSGKPLTLAHAKGNLTTNIYDGFDRLAQTRFPTAANGAVSNPADYIQLSYDPGSNVVQERKRSGEVIGYSYDALGRRTLKDVPTGAYGEYDVSYAYDNLGRATSITRTDGHFINAAYDALGRQLRETTIYGTKSMQYDLAGQRTRLTWPDGNYVAYDVDVLGEMTAIRENGAASGVGVLATFAYDDLGRRTSLARGNGTVTSYAYDAAARLATLTQDLGGTAQDLTIGLGNYNPAGQLGSKSRSNDAYAWTRHYNVDRAYTANGLNQLATAGALTLSYDAKGNLASDSLTSYSYTSEKGLAVGGPSWLLYDAVGRLIYNAVGAGYESFDYDGNNLITEMDGNGSNAIKRRYVHGLGDDEPLVWYEGAGLGDRRWLHANEQGSIVAVTDGAGNVMAINSYNEYGIGGAVQYGRFGYTGQAWLPDAGLYWYKTRMYSPTLGRFLQTDTIGYSDGPNMYNYVGGDPVNGSDPMGTCGGKGNECIFVLATSHPISFYTVPIPFPLGRVGALGRRQIPPDPSRTQQETPKTAKREPQGRPAYCSSTKYLVEIR